MIIFVEKVDTFAFSLEKQWTEYSTKMDTLLEAKYPLPVLLTPGTLLAIILREKAT